MQITKHIYATHIEEDPGSFGAMHPGGTHIYFVGDPEDHMVMVDSGEPYRSWTKQISDFHAELGKPRISAILITHGHGRPHRGAGPAPRGVRLCGALPAPSWNRR